MSNHKFIKQEIISVLLLYGISLSLFLLIAFLRGNSGYMDESYYLMGARNLSQNTGFQEQILWNFMDDPVGLPHPAFLYWMPLISIIAAGGMKLFGATYFAAAVPLSVIAALIPPLTYIVIRRWLESQFWAVIGGLFAMIGGYYLPYYSAIDGFSLYMLLGLAYFVVIARIFSKENAPKLILLGAISGCLAGGMHLTRADGLLWALMIPVFFFGSYLLSEKKERQIWKYIVTIAVALGVYSLTMLPWFYRNLQLFGYLTAAGSSKNFFLLQYNDLFYFPVSELTFSRWFDAGLGVLIQQRLQSAGTNLLSLLGVQLMIFLLPFAVVGIKKNWKSPWVKVNLFSFGVLFLFLTIVFPLTSARGTFFHSATLFQIFIWAMSLSGLKFAVDHLPLNEGLNRKHFQYLFAGGFLVLALTITWVISLNKITNWQTGTQEIARIDETLTEMGIDDNQVILINDPATFNWVTNRPAIVIPGGDEDMMFAVMNRYSVDVVVLQYNHPPELDQLYLDPENSDDFSLLTTEDTWYILERKD